MKERLVPYVYAKVAFPLLRRVARVNPIVIYYHIVSDTPVRHVGNLYSFKRISQFEKDMDTLLRCFRPLSLQEFLMSLQGRQTVKPGSFMLTFDDGLMECHEIVAPILQQKGIPAAFFLCSAFVDNKEMAYDFKKALLAGVLKTRKMTPALKDQVCAVLAGVGLSGSDLGAAVLLVDYLRRSVLEEIAALLEYDFQTYLGTVQPYLTSEQVIELLKMGHAVGAHGIDHPRYADLPLAEQIHQTRASVKFVRDRFDLKYGAFSFPHSDAHVSEEFFREIFATGEVDVCFGNQGMLEDSVPRNFQRSSMEKTSMPAEAILGKGLARRFLKTASGQLVVRRT